MKCPGQDSRYWGPEAIFNVDCPACGTSVEFFKDEATRRCTKCGFRFRNPSIDVGCAQWCKYAKQCFGDVPLTEEDTPLNKVSVLDSLVEAVREVVGEDEPGVRRGMRVVAQAQELLLEEEGLPKVVFAAALLGDLESPGHARRVLERADVDAETAGIVLGLVRGKSVDGAEKERMVVLDASELVKLDETLSSKGGAKKVSADAKSLRKQFATKAARRRAKKMVANAS
jgi:hypothetical protein